MGISSVQTPVLASFCNKAITEHFIWWRLLCLSTDIEYLLENATTTMKMLPLLHWYLNLSLHLWRINWNTNLAHHSHFRYQKNMCYLLRPFKVSENQIFNTIYSFYHVLLCDKKCFSKFPYNLQTLFYKKYGGKF